ncbi:hydroxymethylglutaryl-CoA reductase, degradative [Weissella diestrammenae]|uniref:3-hydroxy-3-methylglutaryl coenzyme A reductase n=1 Tax=Weissella diestrammenae TaxID=1162633 RepID=A0A7G9T794_9LACO|nr:hydroxymethylglutaryl-CoA reductase, degradative [Weissella diestrammenae]MCM0582426.1 hydroxymethylglutaryl-CoA reductase, degradative [Weissella diestrammenae]QNN75969.1 hydroxymethylglutaryl-CoA reductase, degradative [Weissella diestrammenae]
MSNWHGFYRLSIEERMKQLMAKFQLSTEQVQWLTAHQSLVGDTQIENYIYNFEVPTGLLFDLPVNGGMFVVPMSTEEPSVVAAANNGAKMLRTGTGVIAEMTERLMRGQIIVTNLANQKQFAQFIADHTDEIISMANQAKPSLVKRGGGVNRLLIENIGPAETILNVLVDTSEAMGANIVNTISETVARYLRENGYQVLMAILSNLTNEAIVKAKVSIPVDGLIGKHEVGGLTIAKKIALASQVEQMSPFRAATANKGLLNGIEAVVLASGNDTRSVSAALHAYAAQSGQYRGLIHWQLDENNKNLIGTTELPLMLGVVGGSIGIVPAVKLNHQLMGNPSAKQLAYIVAGVGLAQNLAALRALVTEGIQAGHMQLQAKSLAVQIGAVGDEISRLTVQLQTMQTMSEQVAKEQLMKIRGEVK